MMTFQKVQTTENLADILTKDFKEQDFQRKREMIGMEAEKDKQVKILKNLEKMRCRRAHVAEICDCYFISQEVRLEEDGAQGLGKTKRRTEPRGWAR